MKYLITGKDGQLGNEFVKRLENNSKDEIIALGHRECDISNIKNVLEVFSSIKPDIVINCAAYNLVDKAEENYITAIKVNGIGTRNLAFSANRYNSFLIHYSTDYVFDGEKEGSLYKEEDLSNPINEYGKSKLLGEVLLREETERFLLFRVSWVYVKGKQNFINKVLEWAKEGEYLKVSYDEVSIPTSTRTIVDVTLKALKQGLKGFYHLTNSGYASRYEWAKEILKLHNVNKIIYPVSKDIFNLPAKRPSFSAMSNEKISKELNITIPNWREELYLIIKKI